MLNLLTRDQLLMITEKTVDWNKSALGATVNAGTSLLSWLTGSIKKGIKKRQLNTLAMQWGIEYVNALKAYDTGSDVKPGSTSAEPALDAQADSDKPNDGKVTEKNRPKYLETLKSELNNVTIAKTLIGGMENITATSNEAGFKQLKDKIAACTFSDETILNVLPNIKDDTISKFNVDFKAIKSFMDYITSADNISKFLSELKLNIKDKDKFKNTISDVLKNFTSVENGYNVAIKYLTDLKFDATTTNVPSPTPAAQAQSESMMTEAASYKLPTNVNDLLSQDDLLKFKNIPGIKNETFTKINFKRLDTIKYEADYILNASKAPGAGKDGETNAELQRVWDVGIKNVNDYFQDVIDVDKVMLKVSPKDVDEETKKAIMAQQKDMTDLQKMDITETFPAGKPFDVNELYAFDCVVMGQNNKSHHYVLLMSPTKNFTERLDDVNSTFYWFKLMGAYTWDDKQKKIVRINLFSSLTQNQKIVDNFKQEQDAYYIALRNLRPSTKQSYVWVYSNTGKFFFNNGIADDVDTVADEVKKYKKDKFDRTLDNLSSIANMFRIKINNRFVAEVSNDAGVQRYPGIEEADLRSDKGFDRAKSNHDKFIEIIK